MAKEIMNVQEAAEYLGISKMWLYKACKEGHVPHVRFGNKYRFYKETLDNWMKESTEMNRQIKVTPYQATSGKGKRSRGGRKAIAKSEGSES